MSALDETLARDANIITIGYNSNNTLKINKMLSYDIAILKEINPDFPRNLAKVVAFG